MDTATTKTIAGNSMELPMNKFIAIVRDTWEEVKSVFELMVYLGIAYGIGALFKISFLESVAIVFIYFALNLLRVYVEILRRK